MEAGCLSDRAKYYTTLFISLQAGLLVTSPQGTIITYIGRSSDRLLYCRDDLIFKLAIAIQQPSGAIPDRPQLGNITHYYLMSNFNIYYHGKIRKFRG